MFDLISQSMLFLLESLKSLVGNYGWAIIAMTVLVRLVLWPMSHAQMRSMKMMQELQPKLKQIQERHKADPQRLQSEMFKLYKDHKFNPLGGCLPMLVQIPLFLGLFWAISNPHFMAQGDPVFLDFIHLKNTGVISHGGTSNDGKMSLAQGGGGFLGFGGDHLAAGPKMTIYLSNGTTLTDKNVPNANHALTILPKSPLPGVPLTLSTTYTQLELQGYEGLVNKIEMQLVNNSTKEAEQIVFIPQGKSATLQTQLETAIGKTVPHFDVLVLVVIFALSMLLSQKVMSNQTPAGGNEQQQQLMKMMPIMFSVMLFLFPIPAGVLLYMDTNSIFQLVQTWWFNKSHNSSIAPSPSQAVVDIKPDPSKA